MAEPDPRTTLPQVEILLSMTDFIPGIAVFSRSLAASLITRSLLSFFASEGIA